MSRLTWTWLCLRQSRWFNLWPASYFVKSALDAYVGEWREAFEWFMWGLMLLVMSALGGALDLERARRRRLQLDHAELWEMYDMAADQFGHDYYWAKHGHAQYRHRHHPNNKEN